MLPTAMLGGALKALFSEGRVSLVRLWAAIFFFGVAAGAVADRFLLTPTGNRVRPGTVRVEALAIAGRPTRSWLEAGITTNLDLGVSHIAGGSASLDLTWNYLLPITDIAPGISFGLLDLADKTPERRAAYLAFTKRFGNMGDLNSDIPTEFTLGMWTRDRGQPFASVSFPFADQFRLIAETSGGEIRAGFDVRPIKDMSVRVVWMDGRPSAGLRLSQKL